MEAEKAKAISDGVKKRAELAREENIYLDAVLKEIRGRAHEGYVGLCVRREDMNLTSKDIAGLRSLGYEVKHEHQQNWDAWQISW